MKVLKWTVQLHFMISIAFSCDMSQYNQFLNRCQLRFKNGKVNIYNEGTSPYEDLIFNYVIITGLTLSCEAVKDLIILIQYVKISYHANIR